MANLLNNAAKYTDPGGQIALEAERQGDEAVIRVRDNGIGLGPEILPRVFDLFAQEARSLDRSQGGLGIGLTLVRSLVQLHGGSIRAESDGPGLGSRFTVRLPASSADPAPVVPALPSPTLVDSGRSAALLEILVVDDSLDSARSLARVLKLWGHRVEVAHDGLDAIETARSRPLRRPPARHRPARDGRLPGRRGDPGRVRPRPADPHRPDRIRPGGGLRPVPRPPGSTPTSSSPSTSTASKGCSPGPASSAIAPAEAFGNALDDSTTQIINIARLGKRDLARWTRWRPR